MRKLTQMWHPTDWGPLCARKASGYICISELCPLSTVNSLIIFRSLVTFLWNSRPRCESVPGPSPAPSYPLHLACCVVTLLPLLACFVLIFMASSCHFHNVAFDTFPLGSTTQPQKRKNTNKITHPIHIPYYLTLYGRSVGIACLPLTFSFHLASLPLLLILCKMFLKMTFVADTVNGHSAAIYFWLWFRRCNQKDASAERVRVAEKLVLKWRSWKNTQILNLEEFVLLIYYWCFSRSFSSGWCWLSPFK